MKQIICVGNHPDFNALRLGLRLARALQGPQREVVLAGVKGKLPKAAPVPVLEFAPAAKAKTWAAAFAKQGADKIISLASLTACEAAALAGLPYIYCEPENLKEPKPVKNKKALLQQAQKVLVIGTGSKALDKKRYGAQAVRVKNPAVWVRHGGGERPACFRKANNIVAVGAWSKNKSLPALLQAWAKLAPLHGTWHLTLAGEGTGKAAVTRFIQKNQLQDQLLAVALADLGPLKEQADIFISLDRPAEELLDAMASTLPVLAAESAAAQELITNGVDGLLLPAEADAWASALDGLMVDWGRRVGLALEAAKMQDRFPFELFASFFEEA